MMEVDETVEELAVKFAENCGWKRVAEIESNILRMPNFHEEILQNAYNTRILFFLRQSLVYFLLNCKSISIRSQFGDSVYTIFEGLKQHLRTQVPFKFSAAEYLRNFNWFSVNERLEFCLPFVFETNRPLYAIRWLREITTGLQEGFQAQTYFMDTDKFEVFVQATKASLVFLQVEASACDDSGYRTGFDETVYFWKTFAEWHLFDSDDDYQSCFRVLQHFVGLVNERDDTVFQRQIMAVHLELQAFCRQKTAESLIADTFTTLSQYIHITEGGILNRLTSQNIHPWVDIIELIAKQSLKFAYIKFCSTEGCKKDSKKFGGFHELHDLSIVALMIFKMGVARALILPHTMRKISSLFGYAMVKIPKMDCVYALNMRKTTLKKLDELKEICTSDENGSCVLNFMNDLLKRKHAPRPCQLEWQLFDLAFKVATKLNADDHIIVYGFTMILKYYSVPSFPIERNEFLIGLKTALERKEKYITPLDFKHQVTSLPDFGLAVPNDVDGKAVLKFFVDLFIGINDDVSRKLIELANEHIGILDMMKQTSQMNQSVQK